MTVAHALVAAVVIEKVVNAAENDDASFDAARRLLGMLIAPLTSSLCAA
jgi:hypothetical protein